MLKLRDFFHLPQVDDLVAELVADGPGLIVVAGLDPRPSQTAIAHGRASGRSTIFRVLMRELLTARLDGTGIVVTDNRASVRIPRELRRRVETALVRPPLTYAGRIHDAATRAPDLLVIDHLNADTIPAAFAAARQGVRVFSQFDTVFSGADVARHLLDFHDSRDDLAALTWIVTVQSLPTLCSHCKQPHRVSPDLHAKLRRQFPALDDLMTTWWPDAATRFADGLTIHRANGCPTCGNIGLHGYVTLFDIFRAAPASREFFAQTSRLPMAVYALHLALMGHVPLDDVLDFEAGQVRQAYDRLVASERALREMNAQLERKIAETEAANRVLEQRTRALISLQELGQALTTTTELDDLAGRVCRQARDLCRADRAVLYYLHTADEAEILAVVGWDAALMGQRLTLDIGGRREPAPFNAWPPGVEPRMQVEGMSPRAGLSVPLVAQGVYVGLMIVHTMQERFAPGDVALLQTFASQAALALQRAGLIRDLRAKIDALEAAQVELARTERLERELELARQVQQSVLPHTFPPVTGYQFAALNEPARMVGGDFYDVIQLDDEHFGVVIGDVSDKGMPAALYMTLTRSLILAEARRQRSPRAVLQTVNQLLLELGGDQSMFVTVFYGVVERPTRRLTYARAGHDHPLLLRNGSLELLGGEGTLLGLLGPQLFFLSEEVLSLAIGDRLVLYTDGLTDVQGPDGEFLDLEGLQAVAQDYNKQPPDTFCDSVFGALSDYRGAMEQFDDMTMLVVQVE